MTKGHNMQAIDPNNQLKDGMAGNAFGSVKLIDLSDSLQGLAINHDTCHGKVSLYGGQILTWQPRQQQAVLWLSDTSNYTVAKAIRGGIPLCWPWFGGYKDAGNHGFARTQRWQLDSIDIEQHSVTIVLSWQGENIHALWPTAAKLKQRLVFGKDLRQSLTMTNLSEQAVQYSAALHAYLQVSSSQGVSISGLATASFDDKLTGQPGLSAPINQCLGPIDRIYQHNAQVVLVDNHWQRSIAITPYNTGQTVVWNPGIVTAKTMSDVHNHGENEFVCIEPANTAWQTLAPGKAVTIGQTITILPHG